MDRRAVVAALLAWLTIVVTWAGTLRANSINGSDFRSADGLVFAVFMLSMPAAVYAFGVLPLGMAGVRALTRGRAPRVLNMLAGGLMFVPVVVAINLVQWVRNSTHELRVDILFAHLTPHLNRGTPLPLSVIAAGLIVGWAARARAGAKRAE